MTYCIQNFKTKKALKDALAAGEQVEVFEPNQRRATPDGTAYLEGPHSPQPHRWYAAAEVKNGVVVRLVKERGVPDY